MQLLKSKGLASINLQVQHFHNQNITEQLKVRNIIRIIQMSKCGDKKNIDKKIYHIRSLRRIFNWPTVNTKYNIEVILNDEGTYLK